MTRLFLYVRPTEHQVLPLLIGSRTGATGFIGGEVLQCVSKAAPNIEVTALVRDVRKGTELLRAYPNVHVVYGDLDDSYLIEQTAEKVDIVVRTTQLRP